MTLLVLFRGAGEHSLTKDRTYGTQKVSECSRCRIDRGISHRTCSCGIHEQTTCLGAIVGYTRAISVPSKMRWSWRSAVPGVGRTHKSCRNGRRSNLLPPNDLRSSPGREHDSGNSRLRGRGGNGSPIPARLTFLGPPDLSAGESRMYWEKIEGAPIAFRDSEACRQAPRQRLANPKQE